MKRSRQDCLVDPCVAPYKDLLLAGAPLIDFLRVDTERSEGLAFPSQPTVDTWRSNRGIPPEYPCTVTVREFVLGRSPKDNLFEIDRWIRKMWKEDQDVFPSRVLSFDT